MHGTELQLEATDRERKAEKECMCVYVAGEDSKIGSSRYEDSVKDRQMQRKRDGNSTTISRTFICIIIRLSVLILIEPFSVFIGFTWCYFYTQFFFFILLLILPQTFVSN